MKTRTSSIKQWGWYKFEGPRLEMTLKRGKLKMMKIKILPQGKSEKKKNKFKRKSIKLDYELLKNLDQNLLFAILSAANVIVMIKNKKRYKVNCLHRIFSHKLNPSLNPLVLKTLKTAKASLRERIIKGRSRSTKIQIFKARIKNKMYWTHKILSFSRGKSKEFRWKNSQTIARGEMSWNSENSIKISTIFKVIKVLPQNYLMLLISKVKQICSKKK